MDDDQESCHRWLPALAIVAASVCFSILALLVRELSIAGVPTFQIIVIRGAVQVLFCVGYFVRTYRPWRTWLGENLTEAKWLSFRALFGFGGITFNFLGLASLPLAETQVLGQLLPVYAPIVAWLLLREPWYFSEMISAMFGIVGVIFIARPATIFGSEDPVAGSTTLDETKRYLGVVYCMLSTFCAAVSFVIVRLLGTKVKVHWALVMLYQALAQTFFAGLCLKTFSQVPIALTYKTFIMAFAAGMCGSFGQAFNTWGMQREKAAFATLVQKGLSPLLGFINQVVFLPADPVYLTSVAGFIVTGASVIVVTVGKIRRERSKATEEEEEIGYCQLSDTPSSGMMSRQRTLTSEDEVGLATPIYRASEQCDA